MSLHPRPPWAAVGPTTSRHPPPTMHALAPPRLFVPHNAPQGNGLAVRRSVPSNHVPSPTCQRPSQEQQPEDRGARTGVGGRQHRDERTEWSCTERSGLDDPEVHPRRRTTSAAPSSASLHDEPWPGARARPRLRRTTTHGREGRRLPARRPAERRAAPEPSRLVSPRAGSALEPGQPSSATLSASPSSRPSPPACAANRCDSSSSSPTYRSGGSSCRSAVVSPSVHPR